MNMFTWAPAHEGSCFMEIKALLPSARAPALELGPAAPRRVQGSGTGQGRHLLDHIQNPQSLQGQDLISPREDTSDINSHTIADVSQKTLVAQDSGMQHSSLSKTREIYVCDDIAKPLEKGEFCFSCVSQMGPYSKSSFPSSPIPYYYD